MSSDHSADVTTLLNALLEQLADLEHQRWSHWQMYMHDQGIRQADGGLLLPADLIRRWDAQISKEYGELSEAEKESDRDQVRRYLPLIASILGTRQ